MSWVQRTQRGIWIHNDVQDRREDVLVQTKAPFVRNLCITATDGVKVPFKAHLSQSCIPYWYQAESIAHVWRTPFRIAYSSETMTACYITAQFPNDVKDGYTCYLIEWEESRESSNAFDLTSDAWRRAEPVVARL